VCDPRKRKANLEEARRTIPVARGLGAGNIRIFGGGDPATHSRDELVQAGLDCLAEILDLDGAGDLNWLFETHDHWIASEHCRRLLDSIPSPAFGVLWDMGHTPRVTDESPAQTLAAIGQRIGYTHVKDALYAPDHPESMADGWRYVLPGTGQLPLQEAIQGLRDLGYDGWLTFEHEKRWHPELAEPEEAFPAFVRWAREAVDRTL
jgi:sugar phosphate isomerase/epimerase